MTNNIIPMANKVGLLAGMTFLAVLTGCMVESSSSYREHGHSTVVIEDDYDYYPGYETYYSRNRHEFIYRDGNTWVRRPEPRGVSANVLLVAPSVRLDFHDAPEKHHSTVIHSYPKTWKNPEVRHDARQEHPDIKAEHRDVPHEQPIPRDNTKKDNRPDNKQDDRKDDNKGTN
jgi:hypothetical protein